MRFLPIVFLLLILLIAPSARAAPPPLTADFTLAPEAPAPGETVTFTSTSFAPSGGFIATEWDLDNDGAFDDGRKPVVTQAFPAGTHTVRLEARLAGPTPRTEIATKTFTVAAPATPTPTATPDPTPAATPTAIPTTPVGCETSVQRGLLSATGECLRSDGDRWRSSKPVKVNGVTITPAPGREVFIGVGEGGAIGAPAAVVNAVADALAPLGVRITDLPLAPAHLVALLDAAATGPAPRP